MTIKIINNEEDRAIEFWDGDDFIVSWDANVIKFTKIQVNELNAKYECTLDRSVLRSLLEHVYHQGERAQAKKQASVFNQIMKGQPI